MSATGDRMPSSIETALRSCCPRCGKGKLYDSFLTLAPGGCRECGLDYGFADAGDGPAVFIMMIAGFAVVGLALWVEVTWSPPYWLHAVLWIPLTLFLTIGLLRPLKSWLVAQQYRHGAREGRLRDEPEDEGREE